MVTLVNSRNRRSNIRLVEVLGLQFYGKSLLLSFERQYDQASANSWEPLVLPQWLCNQTRLKQTLLLRREVALVDLLIAR